jgi:predicted nuclease with TOPRIM domain
MSSVLPGLKEFVDAAQTELITRLVTIEASLHEISAKFDRTTERALSICLQKQARANYCEQQVKTCQKRVAKLEEAKKKASDEYIDGQKKASVMIVFYVTCTT